MYNKEGLCRDELKGFMREIREHAAESAGSAQFTPQSQLLAACPRLRWTPG